VRRYASSYISSEATVEVKEKNKEKPKKAKREKGNLETVNYSTSYSTAVTASVVLRNTYLTSQYYVPFPNSIFICWYNILLVFPLPIKKILKFMNLY